MVWFAILIFSWLDRTPSIFVVIILAVGVILNDYRRIRSSAASPLEGQFLYELSSGIGNLLGVIVGAIYFL